MAQFKAATTTLNLVAMRVFRLALSLGLFPLAIAAQSAPEAVPQRSSRSELAARLQQLEGLILSADRADHRSKLQAEQAAIRARLESGDFKVGDRFVMTLRLDSVRVDTASVRDSLVVSILNLPDLHLKGVLRSELDEKLNQHVARYIRNASVRSSVLTRIAILGAVRAPGFYYVSPDRPVSDILMVAGGPGPDADLRKFVVRRGTKVLVSPNESKQLIESGRTIEQMDIQSGDEVRIPQKRRFNWQVIAQLALVASTLVFAILQFQQWYYSRQEQ